MIKKVRTAELFDCSVPYLRELFSKSVYPWEILPEIGAVISNIQKSLPDGFSFFRDGILIGRGVEISESAVLIPPLVIGHNTKIRTGAYLRGNVITGEGCILGNSSEYKNCILLDLVQTPHYNYVGDSILGNRAHMGAASIISNLKSDGLDVIIHAEEELSTALRKVGGFLGDGADIGSGCVLNPGTVIGKNTSVYPLTSLRGVYPEDSIVKSQKRVIKRIT